MSQPLDLFKSTWWNILHSCIITRQCRHSSFNIKVKNQGQIFTSVCLSGLLLLICLRTFNETSYTSSLDSVSHTLHHTSSKVNVIFAYLDHYTAAWLFVERCLVCSRQHVCADQWRKKNIQWEHEQEIKVKHSLKKWILQYPPPLKPELYNKVKLWCKVSYSCFGPTLIKCSKSHILSLVWV